MRTKNRSIADYNNRWNECGIYVTRVNGKYLVEDRNDNKQEIVRSLSDASAVCNRFYLYGSYRLNLIMGS